MLLHYLVKHLMLAKQAINNKLQCSVATIKGVVLLLITELTKVYC